ncbi:MAG: cysteine desulfurase CsdA [Gammaproteobacteria bacterium]|nr:MAG: cysteine desulfurase CsdA [Gammaproteobacteria bacterium]
MTLAANKTLVNITRFRQDFPILQQEVNGKPLAYLDNGATTQKPQIVIDTVRDYYERDNANVHRGVHTLSARATDAYEAARHKIKDFINANSEKEIIFTGGTTEAINLVASSYGQSRIGQGDEILISTMEHHSNIVPWQMLCQRTGATLKVIPMNKHGELLFDEFKQLINARTKLLAIVHVSNALGTINPIEAMITIAHQHDVPVLVDGAQAIAHTSVDVQALDVDFYAFSGHKMFGPTGIGVLYGKQELLEAMPPYQGGGDMISVVSFSGTTYNELPYKFEAGTPNIAGVIGLGAAVDYLTNIGLDNIAAYEHHLLDTLTDKAQDIEGLRIIGQAENKTSILSFLVDGAHAADIGELLDQQGVAIRAGHHCAMPVMEFFHINASARASLAFYNNEEDITQFIAALNSSLTLLR